MKIFNAMFSKVNGGLEQVFLNYIPALSSQGNQVIPIIHPKAEIKNSCPKDHLITVHNFNQHDFFAIHRLKKLIQIHQPDCIITHSYRAAYLFKKTRPKFPRLPYATSKAIMTLVLMRSLHSQNKCVRTLSIQG